MAFQYKRIDVDSHVQEKPDTWTSRMSKKWGDRVPHIQEIEPGKERWFFNGKQWGAQLSLCQGVMPDRVTVPQRWSEVPTITYTAEGYIQSMDRDGVSARVMWPNTGGPSGGAFVNTGSEFEAECCRAYNDHLTEDYYQINPYRFIPLAQVPMSSVEAAVEEVLYTTKRGHKGFVMLSAPEQHGLPDFFDRYWDPLWATAQELGIAAHFHNLAGARRLSFGPEPGVAPSKALGIASVATFSLQAQLFTRFLFGGVLDRFPGLAFVGAESGIGWVPFALEAADWEWERCRLWDHGLPRRPSDVFRAHCYVDFWYEQAGLQVRDFIGVDRILWETDFPHPTSIWPAADKWLAWSMEGVPEEDQYKILVENPKRVYKL